MRQALTLSALILFVMGATACGNKGPLKQPQPESPVQQTSTQ